MRLKLSLKPHQSCYLALKYQGLSAAIYKKQGHADPALTKWRHEKRYGHDRKECKLFCFGGFGWEG